MSVVALRESVGRRVRHFLTATFIAFGLAAVFAGCGPANEVPLSAKVVDGNAAIATLKKYGMEARWNERSGKLFVDAKNQQKAAMVLVFNGMVDGDDFTAGAKPHPLYVPDPEMTSLKVPVPDPQAAVLRLARYGIHATWDSQLSGLRVPRKREEQAAMILTFTGLLPSGRKAYGFLNEQSLANKDMPERMQYVTRLQDMLAETIAASPDILQAEVFLTEHAKPWEFRSEDKKLDAKASVKVETSHGGRLTEEQQLSIASLIAGAWPSLTEGNVRISDFELNYYPTVDESWQMNFMLQSRQRQLQRDAESKIELQLSAYNARAAVTIPMLIVKVESTDKRGKTQYGTSGEEADAGRDEIHDPGRHLDANPKPAESTPAPKRHSGNSGQNSDAGRDVVHDPGHHIDDIPGSKSAHNDIFQPDYANASAAITLIHPTELSADKIAEAKQIASAATGIPVDRIAIHVEKPSPSSANR